MPVITISRGSFSGAKEVAEKVAQRLGYECISRDILIEAAEEFHVPEVKLHHAFEDPPSVLDRFTYGRERFIAYIRAALLHHFQNDNVVYHGLAGHYFVRGIAHVLKVRILADMEDRVKLVMKREGLSQEKAVPYLHGIDEGRRKWGQRLYGIDTNDASNYDLVIRLHKITADDAADIVCHAAGLDHFQATAESQQAMADLYLASRAKARLVEHHPRLEVAAKEGTVYIALEGGRSADEKKIREVLQEVLGDKEIDISAYPHSTPD
ncbi:MAG: cytidylate kinase-like family protein [Planctomycetota bacterium]|jgi:cytidylate kinase